LLKQRENLKTSFINKKNLPGRNVNREQRRGAAVRKRGNREKSTSRIKSPKMREGPELPPGQPNRGKTNDDCDPEKGGEFKKNKLISGKSVHLNSRAYERNKGASSKKKDYDQNGKKTRPKKNFLKKKTTPTITQGKRTLGRTGGRRSHTS